MVIVGVPANAQTVEVIDDHTIAWSNNPVQDPDRVILKIKAWDKGWFDYCASNCPSDWYWYGSPSFAYDPNAVSTYYMVMTIPLWSPWSNSGTIYVDKESYQRCFSLNFVRDMPWQSTGYTNEVCTNEIHTQVGNTTTFRQFPGQPPSDPPPDTGDPANKCPYRSDGLPWKADCSGPAL